MDSPLVVPTVIRCPYYLILSNCVYIFNTVNPPNLIKKFQPFLRINTKISSNQAFFCKNYVEWTTGISNPARVEVSLRNLAYFVKLEN